ncbi:MAG: SPOR domain-containing protein [Bacteroidales bacterium]|nr:SPOR domain-containing protein [Bacteroidales bacterium]MDT8373718.1 SPOR domain-containing protein [Bacteroidales bacterium]
MAGKILLILILAALFHPSLRLSAQDEPLYDEIAVYIKIPYLGMGEIDVLIRDQEVWLPVAGFFDFIRIRNVPSEDLNTVTGFFIDQEAGYIIDRESNTITFEGHKRQLDEGDLVRSETGLYMRAALYGRVFGLECRFSFRDLTINVETQQELPAIRELKLEEMRANMRRLKGEIVVDTIVDRSYPAFRFGMADWSLYATEQEGGVSQARMNLSLGAVIAGGEATASFNYYTGDAFSEKQQYYLWRHVNNNRSYLRQIIAGKITSQATASVYDPVVGIQLTNTPTTFRRSFGSYTLTDKTEPGWMVELYVNNVLVDYVRADASGFFTFDVPLVYGNTMVKLKFYGPWGEERTREQNLTIPYNFVPHRELEYTFSAGVVEDSLYSRYSRASISYGATRFLTVGGGAEYLSSVTSQPFMPYVNASIRLPGNIMLAGEYTSGVRTRGTLSYRLPSNIQLDLSYIYYDKDQEAISYNYLEERRASLSVPVRIKKFSAWSRLSLYQIVLPVNTHTTAELMMAGSVMGVNTNLTTYGIITGENDPIVYSNLSLGIRLPARFLLMPQVQYSYTGLGLMNAKVRIEKRLFERGYLNVSWERNFLHDIRMGEIGMRYDFSFAQAGVSARQTNRQATFVQYARGSLISDGPTHWLRADNRTNVGRGGISVVAFLDLNANGIRDAGEPGAPGLNVRSGSGRLERSEKDTTIHITGLEPYVRHFLEIDENSFDNISWRVTKKSYAVIADPNMLKLIEIPVLVRGEATGTVTIEDDRVKRGLGRILVNFRDSNDLIIAKVLTEDDGYFSWFGLAPGDYSVFVDTAQLGKLYLISEPGSIKFSVISGIEGDYIEGLDFTLRKKAPVADTVAVPEPATVADTVTVTATELLPVTDSVPAAVADTAVALIPTPERVVTTDTSYLVIHEVTRELVTITEDYYAVQFGAFRNKLYAEIMKQKVEGALDKNVELFEEDGFWKVRITGFDDREDLEKYIPVIQGQGITEIWVITNKAVKGEWITTGREDSLAVVRETVTEKPVIPMVISGNTLQLGAFETVEETESISNRLLAAAEKLVTVRQDEGLWKVQITGFADTTEIRDFIPLLQERGFTDILVLHQTEEGLVPVTPVVIPEAAEAPAEPGMKEIPVPQVLPEPAEAEPEQPVFEEEIVPPPPPAPVPRFLLHAGSYRKLSEAERAKKKIERRLNLPVEIIEDWDSYRVVVTGFFTREETYPYYPELAGMGFSDIFVYEKPLIDR